VNIQGKRHYLWRAVDQQGDVVCRRLSQCSSAFLR
jgi:transposase-like protein